MRTPLFQQFRGNLVVQNASEISTSYASITKRLNKDFWGLDSDVSHRRQVGSYGRGTAINGVSDLDMIFELPWAMYERYKAYSSNGPSQLLQAVKNSLKARYTSTDIKGDGQVVVIEFSKFVVEVLPAFWDANNQCYHFGDTHGEGSWKTCKPIQEIAAVDERNINSNRNLKHACKMIRAWKNTHGINMGGLLIDTLVYNFFGQTKEFNQVSYGSYDRMFVALFSYLGNLEYQDYWAAPGSGQRVYSKGKFQNKAKKAAFKCQEALESDKEKKKIKLWREIFGRAFPAVDATRIVLEAHTQDSAAYTTEQFIEDMYPVDIRYDLCIDSDVIENGVKGDRLRRLSALFKWLPIGRSLRFFVEENTVPEPYQLLWKVRNVGPEAERRGIRGQIFSDEGRMERRERTDFHGEHFVEAYIIKDEVCVARDVIEVHINQ